MNWILAAFLEPVVFAFANILDSSLINRFFKNAWALSIFIAFGVAIFVPIVWLIDPPKMLPLNLLPVVTAMAFIELYYGYPYYKALENDDTSVTTSLFSLGKVLVPIISFFWLGEVLKSSQYVGFAIVILASAALTYDHKARFRLNKSFFYMLFSSTLLAVDVVLYKYIFDRVSWGTGYVWTMLISALIGLACLLPIIHRPEIKSDLKALKKNYIFILLIGGLGFIGAAGLSYAISKVPVTVERSISAFQPFFVLLYAVLFRRFLPQGYKEHIDWVSIIKKVLLFIVTIIGVLLTVR